MGPKSLKHTFYLALALVVIISGALISQMVTHRYSMSLLDGASARAENIAHNLALDTADKVLINDLVSLHKLLEDQRISDTAVAYLFITRDGKIITHTFDGGVPVQLVAANMPGDNRTGHLAKIKSDSGERFIDVAWPIFEGKAGVLRLGYSEAPFRSQVRKLRIQMSLITVAVLALALICSQLFIRRLTRPLEALTAAAEKIHEGNLEAKVDIQGRSEVSTLAGAFNRMLQRLAYAMQHLEEYNCALGEKNKALDHAHNQLNASFTIAQDVAAIPDLRSISNYLISKFKRLVTCPNIALIVFSETNREVLIFNNNKMEIVGDDIHLKLKKRLEAFDKLIFLDTDVFKGVPIFQRMKDIVQAATFPFHNQGGILGAMVIGCPKKCLCVKQDLDVMGIILKQSSGALRRALLQEEEIRNLRSRLDQSAGFYGLIGKDLHMQTVYRLIEDVASSDATVLIQGESGTGKELVASAIHRLSNRKDMPFVVINCSAYPATLMESELFGHEKGAFTGALKRKTGRFERGHGGTVFLDEIGEISPSAQIKLLRVLQTHEFESLGGERSIKVDVRVLAATNKNLFQLVKDGQFREDLFYRLNVIPIGLPPLRERRNDIPLLAKHFLNQFSSEQQKAIGAYEQEAMRVLLAYPWPGNVRELENSIEHAVVLAKDNRIRVTDLPITIIENSANIGDDLLPTAPTERRSIPNNEAQLIREVLEECAWNKTVAALQLGISRSTLYEKLKKYAIHKPTLH